MPACCRGAGGRRMSRSAWRARPAAGERRLERAQEMLALVGLADLGAPLAAPTVGRPAPARRPRPRARGRARVLLMDEPFSALDASPARSCRTSCTASGQDRQDHPVRHPRHRRGGLSRRPRRGARRQARHVAGVRQRVDVPRPRSRGSAGLREISQSIRQGLACRFGGIARHVRLARDAFFLPWMTSLGRNRTLSIETSRCR